MKPYLVFKTWIDLDHVLAIGPIEFQKLFLYPPGWNVAPFCEVTFAFREKPLRVILGPHEDVDFAPANPLNYSQLGLAQAIHETLISKWKEREGELIKIEGIGPPSWP